MRLRALSTPLISEGDDLFSLFWDLIGGQIVENTIVCLTSKIVSVSQKDRAFFGNREEFLDLVKAEADIIFSEKGDFVLAEKDGLLLPNAGVDESNAPAGTAIFLPKAPQKFCDNFRFQLLQKSGKKNIGVLIADSFLVPRRRGITGVALAWSGFEGVSSEVGKSDLFGRSLAVSHIAVADNFASMAQNFFGQANEKIPFVLFEEAMVSFTDNPQERKRGILSAEEDFFGL